MPVTIKPANSGPDLETFIRLPARLYKGMPGFVAPLDFERRTALDPDKAPFFQHGRASYFLAERDGRPVGRISAQIDDAQPAGVFDDAGLFGCFDAVDDPEVTMALFDAAEDWLIAEGRTRAIGPFLLSMNGEPGLLVEGHLEPPLTLVAWHPQYLQAHLKARGYTGCRDLHYWRLSDFDRIAEQVKQGKAMRARLPDVRIRKFERDTLVEDIETIRRVYNEAWRDNWGFVPLLPVDVAAISKDLRSFMKPEAGVMVDKAEKTVAVAIFFPNLFEIFGDIAPHPSLFGWAKLAWRTYFHKFRSGHIILFGVLPELRHSVGGAVIALTMVGEIVERLLRHRRDSGRIEAGWVLENNLPLQKILLQYGFARSRTLRLYDRALVPDDTR